MSQQETGNVAQSKPCQSHKVEQRGMDISQGQNKVTLYRLIWGVVFTSRRQIEDATGHQGINSSKTTTELNQ